MRGAVDGARPVAPRSYVEAMEVLGVIVLIVLALAVIGSVDSAPMAPPGPARPAAPRPAAPGYVAPISSAARRRELDRQRLADEAFLDGIIFSHHVLDHAQDDGMYGEDLDDDCDYD